MATIPMLMRVCEIIHLGINPVKGGIPAIDARIIIIFIEFSFLPAHWLRLVMFLALKMVISMMVIIEYTIRNSILNFRE